MNFDALNVAACIVQPPSGGGGSGGGGTTLDPRCANAAFAAANPSICTSAYLVLKPGVGLVCTLGSIAFSLYLYQNGVETLITSGATFSSSNDDVLAVGVNTGGATGLTAGEATVSASYQGMSASADITVLAGTNCCDSISVLTSILIDDSYSTSLAFGGGYSSRLAFGQAAALEYANTILQVNSEPKDSIKIWSFTDVVDPISPSFLTNVPELASEIDGIPQTQELTDIGAVLAAAIADITTATGDQKVILLISDGEQTATTSVQSILAAASQFQAAGGIIICIGLRASSGYDLLERIATPGFFLNALPTNAADVLDGLNYLRSIVCAGDCMTTAGFSNEGALDYSSFRNWEVIAGQVNLYGNGFIDLLPGNGLYVDMNGGSAATIQTIDTFALVGGQSYRISFNAAGNNIASTAANQALLVSVVNSDPSVPANLATIFSNTVAPAWNASFTPYAFTFTAPYNMNVRLVFKQLFNTAFTGEWDGDLLDAIVFENVSTLTTLFSDNFDGENPVYGYGGGYGGYCDSAETEDAQIADPNPLPNVETGLTPTVTYNSTKTSCVSCPTGQVNFPTVSLIPGMTSNVLPGGIASDDAGDANAWKAFSGAAGTFWTADVLAGWLQYQFASPNTVAFYSITASAGNTSAPSAFILQGSNDGSTWTQLDSQLALAWYAGETKKFSIVNNSTAYAYYRIVVSATQSGNPPQIAEVALYAAVPTQICSTASATSTISQADADNKATAAATAQAQAQLNCVNVYTSTQTFTANCPVGKAGTPITQSVTSTSLNSLQEANATALALATAAAVAQLVCETDNSQQPTTLAASQSIASPYPSVKFVSGLTGTITKVTLALNGLKMAGFNSSDSFSVLLVSPTSVACFVLANIEANTNGASVNLVIDDAAATEIGSPVVAGTFQCSDNGHPTAPSPAPVSGYVYTLAGFIGENPNGSWGLYLFQIAALAGSATLESWNLTITT
jgi:von Willebrand factor type A domain